MSLKRSPLARKTALARGGPLSRVSVKRAGAPRKPPQKPKDTGPSPAVRAFVLVRADGCCEVCGRQLYDRWSGGWLHAHSVHHRRPRGMGGDRRPDTNSPANLLLLCGTGTDGCHGRIESQRTHAIRAGLLLKQTDDPATHPVQLHGYPDEWMYLRHDGSVTRWVA